MRHWAIRRSSAVFRRFRWLSGTVVLLGLAVWSPGARGVEVNQGQSAAGRAILGRVLFLTHSAGFHHKVVERPGPGDLSFAAKHLKQAAGNRFEIDVTKDCSLINAKNLARYDGVMFYTTGTLPISEDGKKALLEFIRSGHGFIGVHSATDTFHHWPAYGDMIGGYYKDHPWHHWEVIDVLDSDNPATAHLGKSFKIWDEIYEFSDFDASKVHVLLKLDNSSVDISKGHNGNGIYPVAWTKPYGKGRVFYTSLGHGENMWKDQKFLKLVLGGIRWATNVTGVGALPPQGAQVLFDGHGLSQWEQGGGPAHWKLADDTMQVAGGNIRTRRTFKDFRLHVEFRPPSSPRSAHGQARGNSGVYLQNRYEIQVLDSYGVKKPGKGDCGAIYGVKAPDYNVCRPPDQWQSDDIIFHAAKFDANGKKTRDAQVTVYQNGVLIQNRVDIPHSTGGGRPESPQAGPIMLQDHGHPVRYRNIWIVPLD